MLRIALATLCVFSFVLLADGSAAPADEGASSGDDIHQLREMIEQQSKQLDVLAQEIARLNLLLEAKNPALSPIPAAPPPAEATDTTAAAEAPIPKAAPVAAAASAPAGPVHIVTKGETLTAIAKRYKVTIPDILKVNKITDARKLQIGQTLILPPGAKIPESTTSTPPQP